MANNILGLTHTETGVNLYALIRNRAGQIFDATTDLAFEAYLTADITSYDIALTEQGTASRHYTFTVPSQIAAGTYSVKIHKRAGGSPAEGDLLVGEGEFDWDGTEIMSSPLRPTTDGRKVDVSAGGEVGVDWANVGSPTTAVNLSGTTIAVTQKVDVETIKTNPVVNGGTFTFPSNATGASTTNITAGTITTATNVTTVNGLAANVITVASIADGVDAEILSYIVDDATRIDASALNTLSGHDPGETIMGATDLGTGSGLTSLATAAELAKVPKSDSNVTWNATAAAQIQSEANDALVAYDPPTEAEMNARTLAAASYATAANLATVAGYIDTEIATLQTSVDDLPTNAELATALGTADDAVLVQVALVKAKTDNLPSDPADQSIIIAATDALATLIGDVPTNAELATALAGADDATLAAIAALNNLSSAQAQTAAAAALTAYDPPTHAELVSEINSVQSDIAGLTIPSAAAIAAEVAAIDIAGKTLAQAIKYIGATTAGIITTAGTDTEAFKDFAGDVAVTITVDSGGNRSSIVYAA